MDDNDRHNALISAISNGESCLARLDKERHKLLAELKYLKAEFLNFSNSTLDITKDTTASDGILSKISRPLLPLDLSILSVGLDERLGNAPRLSKKIARKREDTSHISIEMQTIIGIISFYAQNSKDMCH